ncbi:hypothetical protein PVAND_003426 [Polypedilum vanderplanki]|uniref:Peptidase S1 domain-containing protein n=1 Tax=Polypedilum vanderplanki TaxID=319348 RepID=A0A9J6BUG6_POLVA|nr:hypothetical protein PVAND_003426 [Polypedilum vanderplanki]
MEKFLLLLTIILFFAVILEAGVTHVLPNQLPLFERKVQGRIVGGSRPSTTQFPYTVSVRAFNGTSTSFCGGSIISYNFVLTAAHCTRGYQDFEIGVGSIVLQTPFFKILTYGGAIEHPYFNPTNLNNDISLIEVPTIAQNVPSVVPVLLPKRSQADKPFIGMQVTVSGFGRTSDASQSVSPFMEYVQLKIISNKDCAGTYGRRIVTDDVICAKGIDKNFNACIGDSGGPLTMKEAGNHVQLGIVSFVSSRGCAIGDPSGYTKVGKYLDWISAKTGIIIRN